MFALRPSVAFLRGVAGRNLAENPLPFCTRGFATACAGVFLPLWLREARDALNCSRGDL